MRILVTGAGGYIGTTLVPMLLAKGHSVRAVDLFAFGKDKLIKHSRLELIERDVRHLPSSAFEGIEGVIDLAAISNDPAGEAFRGQTWEINRKARAETARRAKLAGAKRYVLPSSCAVYGFAMGEVAEDSPLNPLTTYAKANAACERDVLALNDQGFCVTVLRQATVYGLSPRMRFDLAVNIMAHDAWKNGEIRVNGDGNQWRPFVHVSDTARAQALAIEAPAGSVGGQIFNVVGENVRLGELAKRIAQTVPARVEFAGEVDKRSYRASGAKLRALGWKPNERIETAAAEIEAALSVNQIARTPDTITLDWYKAQGTFGSHKAASAA